MVCGGLELRPRETCTFLTFGKVPATPPHSYNIAPLSTVANGRAASSATHVDVCATGNGRERKSSTETGPPDPSAVRPGSGGESASKARCPSPDDDDDVFPVADVGCSSIVTCRSVSVPPRRTRSCVTQPLVNSDVPRSSSAATAVKISPPRMKRRKKKTTSETDNEPRKVGCLLSTNSNNQVLPVASRRSVKSAEAIKQNMTIETGSNNDSNSGEGDHRPVPELSSGRENSLMNREADPKRKKNIRWKTDVAQSSPDVASDDADSKESGYITLEDLQAQLGLSSWSSDERQTDQEVFSSSGDELRAPSEGLRDAQSISSTTSAFGAPSAALLLPPPSSSSFLSPLVPPEHFDTLGGAVDCCRSAPPTCDASVLKFTFTVRLDSKMFHRRAANKGARRVPPLMMVTDVLQRGWCGTENKHITEPAEVTNAEAEASETDEQAKAVVESPSSVTADKSTSPPVFGLPPDQQKTQTSTAAASSSKSAPDCAVSSSDSAQQFAGEKVVVTAEVHRSADQLEADLLQTSTNSQCATSTNHRPKSKSSAVQIGLSSQKGASRRTVEHERARSLTCQPDDIIVSCSPEPDLQCSTTKSLHHARSDQLVDGAFSGRVNYVDIDKVMMSQTAKRQMFDRQQSSVSATSQSSTRKIADGLTLTLRKPLKLRHSDRGATDVKTLPRKKPIETTTGRNQRRNTDTTSSRVMRPSTDSSRRTVNRHFSCERTLGRMFSESSSVSSDSEPDICGPCIARDSSTTTTAACSRGCPTTCGRHANGRPSKTATEHSVSTRSKSTRRALRQFFRVENLFACRSHDRPSSSDQFPSRDDEQRALGVGEEEKSKMDTCDEASRRGVTPGATCRARCDRSTQQREPSKTRSCRRSRPSRSSRGTDVGGSGGGGVASSAWRSVSHDRTTAPAESCCRSACTLHRSKDRSSTVDRCRHDWKGGVADKREDPSSSVQTAVTSDWPGRGGGQRWNTLCVSPSSDNNVLTVSESQCGGNRRRVLATTPISPSTPAPENLHFATLGT